jgi:4-amino-4-deoxy-L-arabinose transferase-like glycosyltransferase
MTGSGGASTLAKSVWATFVVVTAWTIVSTWYLNLGLALDRSAAVTTLALAGAAITVAGVLGVARLLRRLPESAGPSRTSSRLPAWLWAVIAAGIVARLAWSIAIDVPLLSDHAAYFRLAERLYTEGIYQDGRGDRAYWPPGYPFFLFATFAIVGVKSWIPLAANQLFYVATSVATYRIGRLVLDEQAGFLSVLLLAIWPTYVFSAALASKEMLLAALLAIALFLYLRGIDPVFRGVTSGVHLLGSGLTLGLASLTQPSLMLFPGALAAHAFVRRDGLLRSARQVVIVIVGMTAVIAPWAARNLEVLNALIPVATNGGYNFYRANNSLATGGYTATGEHPLLQLNEVERNRAGYRLGIDWILAQPHQFLALAVKKQILFLGDDAHGASETLKRGRGITPLYVLAKGFSNLYWLGLWGLILLALRRHPGLYQTPGVLLLVLSFFYLLAIDSIFESGPRHHMPAIGFLAILAGGALISKPRPAAVTV